MAKTALLWCARNMVVKDNGLFDNLPWTWGAPAKEASQVKRDAYDAFFGKDLGIGKSISVLYQTESSFVTVVIHHRPSTLYPLPSILIHHHRQPRPPGH